MKGKVSWFSEKKGFGFILTSNGDKVFVHHSNISGEGKVNLVPGQEVEFELEEDDFGTHAANVRVSSDSHLTGE